MRWGQAAEAGSGFNSTRVHSASGIGIAMGWHGAGFTGRGEINMASIAGVELGADGVVRILVANTEIGQGTNTVMPMIVAEVLGIEPAEVEMAPIDTSIVPNSGPTVASRTVMVVGGLVSKAAAKLRAMVEARSGGTFADVYRADARRHGATRVDEQYEPATDVDFDDETHTGDAYPAFGWACAVAKVDVDLDTGEVRVRSVVSADDVGRVIHPLLAEGQVEGGTLQAVGYGTIEEIKLQDGRYLNDRLATYIIPTSMDAPRITAILVEAPFSGSPHGAKGVGRAAHERRRASHRRRHPRCRRRLGHRAAGDTRAGARRLEARANDRRPRARRRTPTRRYRFTLNGEPREVVGSGHAAAARRAARGPRPHRHQGGLRRGRVRRLHGHRRRHGRRQLPRPGLPGGRLRDPHGRGPDRRRDAALSPLQQAFLEHGGAQCGICTPGMLMAAQAYLDDGGSADEDDIREAIAGNLCRCTGYTKIIDAIEAAALAREVET